MEVSHILSNYVRELSNKKRAEKIEAYETTLSIHIEELVENNNFYKLPVNSIISIINKSDLSDMDDEDLKTLLQKIIKKSIEAHHNEAETLLFIQIISQKTYSLSHEEILSYLGLFTDCPLLVQLCENCNEQEKEVEVDDSYELGILRKQHSRIKKELYSLKYPELKEKPANYIPDIIDACKAGNLASLRWLIEKVNVNKYQRDRYGNTLIHIAIQYGHLHIVQYLIERQEMDKEIKGFNNQTPLHSACQFGRMAIIKYLLSIGANIEAQTIHRQTPLHYSCSTDNLDVIKLLVSNGANIEARDIDDCTPLHCAYEGEHRDVVNYLLSQGANQNAINNKGERPSDLIDYFHVSFHLQ